VTDAFAWLNPYQNRFILGDQADGGGMASWHRAQGLAPFKAIMAFYPEQTQEI
jgi:hypothetical protein